MRFVFRLTAWENTVADKQEKKATMRRQDYINEIIKALAILSRRVEISASLNLTDLNVHAESFYRDFLSLALGYKLDNINAIDPNAASIDLGDRANRIAIQVTSTSAFKKTRSTVEGFIKKKLYEEYDRLVILNLVEATNHKDLYVGNSEFKLNTKEDIWDYKTLARKIADKKSTLLAEISSFLMEELKLAPEGKLPKEVKTFISLIDLLSDDTHPEAGNGYIEEPDPKGKIYERFASHSGFLTEKYVSLYKTYGNVLMVIKNESDLGPVKVQKIGHYLQSYSDKTLNECNGDPKQALLRMTDHFVRILEDKGIEYDRSAIEFYLVEQLTRCNVFPNLESVHV